MKNMATVIPDSVKLPVSHPADALTGWRQKLDERSVFLINCDFSGTIC